MSVPHRAGTQSASHHPPSQVPDASTALAGTQPFISNAARTSHDEPFPRPVPTVLPMVRFVQPKPSGQGALLNADSGSVHHQYSLSVLQRNPGPARKHPTQILAAACGRFHAVILQEASDHAPRVSDQFIVYTGGTDLANLAQQGHVRARRCCLRNRRASPSRSTWEMAALVVRGLLRRPPLSGSPTVTFCSVHVHNVVAKKTRRLDLSSSTPFRSHGAAQR